MSSINDLGELPKGNDSKNPLVIKVNKKKKKSSSEVLLGMHEATTFTPEDALKELVQAFKRLEKITKKYKKVQFDLDGLEKSVRVVFKAMIHSQDKEKGWIYKALKNESTDMEAANYVKERNMEIRSFRSNYMKWVKNLISDFNRYKLVYKWEWLDVKFLTIKLTELKIE